MSYYGCCQPFDDLVYHFVLVGDTKLWRRGVTRQHDHFVIRAAMSLLSLSAQHEPGGRETGRASPPSEDGPARGRGHYRAAVGRHLQVPARHELFIEGGAK